MTVDAIISGIIEREGRKYTNRKNDLGGPTKFGITLKTLSGWRGVACTSVEVEALTEPEARAIYEAKYVTPFAHLPDCLLRTQLIDIGVTSGPKRAIQYLQKALNVDADGQLGPQTSTALAAHPDWRLLNNQLVGIRIQGFAKLVKFKPAQLENLNGWVNRAVTFLC